jgi:hypothetical protein
MPGDRVRCLRGELAGLVGIVLTDRGATVLADFEGGLPFDRAPALHLGAPCRELLATDLALEAARL